MVVYICRFGKADPHLLTFLDLQPIALLWHAVEIKCSKVEGVLFNSVMPTNVIHVLQYLHLCEFHHKIREERRKETGQEVVFMNSLPVDEAEKVSCALQFSCCFAVFCSGPSKNTGTLESLLTDDLKHMRFIWEHCITVLYFEAGTVEWLDCNTGKWKMIWIWMMAGYEWGMVKKSLQILLFLSFKNLVFREKITRILGWEEEQVDGYSCTGKNLQVVVLAHLPDHLIFPPASWLPEGISKCYQQPQVEELSPTSFCIFLYCSRGWKACSCYIQRDQQGNRVCLLKTTLQMCRFHFMVILG